jgi:thioredoxin-related protein
MKLARLVCLLPLFATAWAGTPAPAQSVLKAAERQAGQHHKNVLLMFHASWCGWCHKMDAMLNEPTLKPGFDRSYEIVHITILENGDRKADENPGGEEMYKALGGGDGIPYYVIFSPTGKVLGDSRNPKNIGYPGEPGEITYFMGLMRKTSHMSAEQLSGLQAFLSKKS